MFEENVTEDKRQIDATLLELSFVYRYPNRPQERGESGVAFGPESRSRFWIRTGFPLAYRRRTCKSGLASRSEFSYWLG